MRRRTPAGMPRSGRGGLSTTAALASSTRSWIGWILGNKQRRFATRPAIQIPQHADLATMRREVNGVVVRDKVVLRPDRIAIGAARAISHHGDRTRRAYGDAVGAKDHFIAYHNAIHLTTHCGQIRMVRNLYRKARGEAALFVPENPTYPGTR